MNLKHAFVFSIAFTCLAPNIFAASAAQGGAVLADSEDSRYQSTPHASTSRKSVSTIANDNRILHDDHGDAGELTMLQELKAIPALDKSRCRDSPLILLLETTGGSKIPFACKSMLKSNNTSCSASGVLASHCPKACGMCQLYKCSDSEGDILDEKSGVLASHCPKACGMCQLYKCSDSEGTFLMRNGRDRDCSWLVGEKKRIGCKKPSVAKTCRTTCKFCPPITSSWQKLGEDIDGKAANDNSGTSVSVSSDGETIAIGNGSASGQTRIYKWSPENVSWVQMGSDIDGESSVGRSGSSVSLSSDGETIAIGSPFNDGINGSGSGYARIYKWSPENAFWVQMGSAIDGEAAGDSSGISVSLSSDGEAIAIGAFENDVNGSNSGHTRIY
eukprot:CAMPEP_0194125226 /NCGR_PEP_ID=MMETSP0150-20130528/59349_1 /TAXON_ID=122233 /ORGANISM="Chaetoceros debilis, Strain MM31A-1" /LENGTH=387 /DNA_ID=CAMNT_0038819023 /DNA_START=108 /DNA_END=1267 /DNA_ORIENTATION=+